VFARALTEELAFAAKRDRKFIWALEKGRQQPSLETQLLLALAIGIKAAEMLDRTEMLAIPASVRERIARNGAALIPLGEETCPGCKAVYTLHARRLTARERRKFKCTFCKHQLSSWAGTTTFIYAAKHPPKSWDAQ
jgi:transcriptional regulator with XRE-family HTH domain